MGKGRVIGAALRGISKILKGSGTKRVTRPRVSGSRTTITKPLGGGKIMRSSGPKIRTKLKPRTKTIKPRTRPIGPNARLATVAGGTGILAGSLINKNKTDKKSRFPLWTADKAKPNIDPGSGGIPGSRHGLKSGPKTKSKLKPKTTTLGTKSTQSGPKKKKKLTPKIVTPKNVVTERLDKSKTVKTKNGKAVTYKKKDKDYRGKPGK
jgi:hypothetical protein|tara:strand:- start:79 stop:702 length:624 start_codon:yes stop_codon:yes gene_type:complete